MKYVCLILCLFLQLSCSARFSSVGGKNGGDGVLKPDPNPKPDLWPGGYLQIKCQFESNDHIIPLGQAGMVDVSNEKFLPLSYRFEQFAEIGWISAEMTFPDHDATKVPVEKPDLVRVEYYIFLRPDWRVPENFYEIRRVIDRKFEMGQQIEVSWPFTSFSLYCQVEKPPSI